MKMAVDINKIPGKVKVKLIGALQKSNMQKRKFWKALGMKHYWKHFFQILGP